MTFTFFSIKAQSEKPIVAKQDLTELNLSEDVSLHIVSPEPIQFVDISSDYLVGDLPTENIARFKIKRDGENGTFELPFSNDLGIVTIVAQSFIAQYKVGYNSKSELSISNIQIQPADMQPIDHPTESISNTQLKRLAKRIMDQKTKRPIRKESNLRMTMQLNNVFIRDDYIFLDITLINKSNLNYDIDKILFSIDDKKVYKATNVQSIQLNTVFQYYHNEGFRRKYRNIYAFKKFTYPNSKVLTIRMAEKQISGRTIELNVKFKDILRADTF